MMSHVARMNTWSPRFTIRTGMIAIAVVAVGLVVTSQWLVLAAVFACPIAALVFAQAVVSGGHRRTAALGFLLTAIVMSMLAAATCIEPHYQAMPAIFLATVFIITPTLVALGVAWAILATEPGAMPRRRPHVAALAVLLLTAVPPGTVVTLWPLRLAFLVSRPALEQLADQAAAGQSISFPRQAGLFWMRGARMDPASHNVGLLLDPNPSGPSGFVRMGPEHNGAGPFSSSGMGVALGGGWEYRQED